MDEREILHGSDAAQERSIDGMTPTEAVVDAVAEVHDCEPTDLPPLNDVFDSEALDGLFTDTLGGRTRRDGHLLFQYCDCTVVVFGSGKVVVDAND